jgi:hypothetical protein
MWRNKKIWNIILTNKIFTVLYVDEWCKTDFCSVCITRQTLFYTNGVPACSEKLFLIMVVAATETCQS